MNESEPIGQPVNPFIIVLVEDEAAIRKLILDILKMEGYQVIPFPSGDDGLAWIRAHSSPINLLITDIRMPGISGKVLADEICRMRPEIKVLFISGFSDFSGEELNRCSIDGGHFLGKPFRASELLSKVHEVLGVKAD